MEGVYSPGSFDPLYETGHLWLSFIFPHKASWHNRETIELATDSGMTDGDTGLLPLIE